MTVSPTFGRLVAHDPRSRGFAAEPTDSIPTRPVMHARAASIWNQGQIGSCTAQAVCGLLVTGPHRRPGEVWTRAERIAIYARATVLDDEWFPGQYPPEDTGSAALFVAKALRERRALVSYHHVFSTSGVLRLLGAGQPVAIGIGWPEGMMRPGPDGMLRVAGDVVGGHEVVLDGIDPGRRVVRLTNSWGPRWGISGRAWLPWDGLEERLADRGDAMVIVRN